jgi:hypothetical protein
MIIMSLRVSCPAITCTANTLSEELFLHSPKPGLLTAKNLDGYGLPYTSIEHKPHFPGSCLIRNLAALIATSNPKFPYDQPNPRPRGESQPLAFQPHSHHEAATHTAKMRGKRSKQYRKLIQQYSIHFGFREPYQVIVDADFVKDTTKCKMDLLAALERTLHGTVKPCMFPFYHFHPVLNSTG